MLGTLKKKKSSLIGIGKVQKKLLKIIIIYVSPFFDEEIGENLDFFFLVQIRLIL
jgi:hypothetical protein